MRDKTSWSTVSDLADTQPSRWRSRQTEGDNRAQLEMLLHLARTSPRADEAMEYVQRAVSLHPEDPRVLTTVQLSVFNRLRSDAFVAFLGETTQQYVVQFRRSRPFAVPKARAVPEAYPPVVRRTEAERALQMIWWMMLGLIPAGLGAVLLSPVALWHGLRALQREAGEPQQRRMAWAAILTALALGFIGACFGALLVLHVLIG